MSSTRCTCSCCTSAPVKTTVKREVLTEVSETPVSPQSFCWNKVGWVNLTASCGVQQSPAQLTARLKRGLFTDSAFTPTFRSVVRNDEGVVVRRSEPCAALSDALSLCFFFSSFCLSTHSLIPPNPAIHAATSRSLG